MNKNITVAHPEIKFRNKFENRIPSGLREGIINSVNEVLSMSADEALNFLWKLTYNPELGLHELGFTSVVSYDDDILDVTTNTFSSMTYIPADLVFPFRNELRYQRSNNHDDFPEKPNVPESCKGAYQALCNATGDVITSLIAFETCSYAINCFDKQSINRCLALLCSNQENNYFGGLRSLGFNYDEAQYLKPYVCELYNLLAALWEEEKAHQNISSNLPMSKLGEMLQANGVTLPEDAVVETETANCSNPAPAHDQHEESSKENTQAEEKTTPAIGLSKEVKHVTASTITENKELFEKFLLAKDIFTSTVKALEEAGFDQNEVSEKAEAISKILEAFQLLE